ncbi:hypothetical protein MCOR33_011065 [Pyricularia grisea]|uniref:Uncharacterized protein n=1 Tax=Pyricularia grisea TaxID=148305 RepID=A0ABQ8N3R7_PYRGI|nr:hypothetical protein MCOR33_011065 [Pyricularia grisea]
MTMSSLARAKASSPPIWGADADVVIFFWDCGPEFDKQPQRHAAPSASVPYWSHDSTGVDMEMEAVRGVKRTFEILPSREEFA